MTNTDGRAIADGMNITKESTWKIVKSTVPYLPDWAILRPMISDNHLVPRSDTSLNKNLFGSKHSTVFGGKNSLNNLVLLRSEKKESLAGMNPIQQEYCLIEDILFCMMSIEGVYIKKAHTQNAKDSFEYKIEPLLETSGCGMLSKTVQ